MLSERAWWVYIYLFALVLFEGGQYPRVGCVALPVNEELTFCLSVLLLLLFLTYNLTKLLLNIPGVRAGWECHTVCVCAHLCWDPVQTPLCSPLSTFNLMLLLINSVRCNYRIVQAVAGVAWGPIYSLVLCSICLPGWLMNHWLPWKFPMTCYRLSRT